MGSNKRFNAVLTSAPVNSAAARVTSRGEHYDQKIGAVETHPNAGIPMHSDVPFQCRPISPAARANPSFIDFTGHKFGRMTVVGWLGRLSKGKKGFWLLRCACGNYEPRRLEKVKAAPPDAACRKCRAWTYTKQRYEKEGSRPIGDFLKEPSS